MQKAASMVYKNFLAIGYNSNTPGETCNTHPGSSVFSDKCFYTA